MKAGQRFNLIFSLAGVLGAWIVIGSAGAWANSTGDAPSTGPVKDLMAHPCMTLKMACENAGFKVGGHKDSKGLHIDCLKPLLEGKSVAGVQADPLVIEACKAKKKNHAKGESPSGKE